MSGFLGILIGGIIQAAILALATFAITLVFKTSLTTNFAQGMVGTICTIGFSLFFYDVLGKYNINWALKFVIIIVLALIVGFLIGLFIDSVLIRFSKYTNPLNKQMITMGLVLIITGLIPTLWLNKNIDNVSAIAFTPDKTQHFSFYFIDGSVNVNIHGLISVVISIVVLIVLFVLLQKTKWGLSVRATASNEKVAGMMGTNTRVITALSWGLASALGTLAALLYAPTIGTLSVSLMVFIQVSAFLAAILGGFSTFKGPVFGAIIIQIVSSILSYIPGFDLFYLVIVYMLVLIVVLFKPVGIFGHSIAKKV
jgi:branched-chain amino acid transport system permease protein